MSLLDVGTLIALTYEGHPAHAKVRDWWQSTAEPAALCRVTQMGLLRLLTNPAVMGDDIIDRAEAWETCRALLAHPRMTWAPEPPGLDDVWRSLSAQRDFSHRLWTHDYLAAFAIVGDCIFVTLDQRCEARYPAGVVQTL